MDGEALTVPDASFDSAFSIFGVMLFSDWLRGLREQARVLRSGGKACVATWDEPPGGGPFIAMGAALHSVFPDLSPPPPPSGMLALSDADRLSAEMSAAGLASIDVHRVEGIWRGARWRCVFRGYRGAAWLHATLRGVRSDRSRAGQSSDPDVHRRTVRRGDC
jgi:SAM-dependent methyltransferase